MNNKKLLNIIEKMLTTVEYWKANPEKLNALEEDILEFLDGFVGNLDQVADHYVDLMDHYSDVCESVDVISSSVPTYTTTKEDPLSTVVGMAIGGALDPLLETNEVVEKEPQLEDTQSLSIEELEDLNTGDMDF